MCLLRPGTKQVGLNLKTENIRTFKSVYTIRFVGVYTDMNTCILCWNMHIHTYVHTYIHTVYTHMRTVEHSYNKPEIPGQSVCYKKEFVISGQFPMRYCSTCLRSLLLLYRELCYRGV